MKLWATMMTAALSASALTAVTAQVAAAQTATSGATADGAGMSAAGRGTGASAPRVSDPWERTNRSLYRFSDTLDRSVLRPGVVFYHHATPTPLRNGIHNAVTNLTGPIIFINDVLQLRPKAAATTAGRFVLNSTAGVGGFIDVGSKAGLEYHVADFGETLGRYGVKSGPYVYVPVLGPSNVRDVVGRVFDSFADPFNWVNYSGRSVLAPTRAVVGGIDARDQVDPLLKNIHRTATDPYATIRSLYAQNRAALIRGEATSAANVQALPDFGPEPAAPPAGSAPNSGRGAPAPDGSAPPTSTTPPSAGAAD